MASSILQGSISTGISAIDEAIGGGGVPPGSISEFIGPPGIGKSALSMLLCCVAAKNSIIASSQGVDNGVHSSILSTEPSIAAIYVDCQGDCTADRLRSLASSTLSASTVCSTSDILRKVCIVRVHSRVELISVLRTIPRQFASSVSSTL